MLQDAKGQSATGQLGASASQSHRSKVTSRRQAAESWNGTVGPRTCIIKRLILPVVLAMAVTGSLAGCQPKARQPGGMTATGSPTTASSPKTSPSPSPPPEPISLSGSGQAASDKFQLAAGLAVFRYSYSGQGNFIVRLLDSSGSDAGLVANQIGTGDGSQAIKIRNAGPHLLDVTGSGSWEFKIEQPRPTSAPDTRQFSGKSRAATDFFHLPGGLTTFKFTYAGQGNFIVRLLDMNGVDIGLVANVIGTNDGSKAIKVPTPGIYFLSIEAGEGDWTFAIT